MIGGNSLKILVIYNNDFSDASFSAASSSSDRFAEQETEPPGSGGRVLPLLSSFSSSSPPIPSSFFTTATSTTGPVLPAFVEEDEVFNGDFARANVVNVAHSIWGALRELSLTDVSVVPINGLGELCALLENDHYDLVVNLCESLNRNSSYEIEVVKVLERYGVPFTGNSSWSLYYSLDKYTCTSILRKNGVSVPYSVIIKNLKEIDQYQFPFPCIVKPNQEDGSTGIDFQAVVDSKRKLCDQVHRLLEQYRRPVLIQRYIDGREINVSLIGDKPSKYWGLSEIDFSGYKSNVPKILNYSSKWMESSSEYKASVSVGPKLKFATKSSVFDLARKTAEHLKINSYARIDMRLDSEERPYVIDVNPNCDLDPEAGFAKTFAFKGVPYRDLIKKIIVDALNSKDSKDIKSRNISRSSTLSSALERKSLFPLPGVGVLSNIGKIGSMMELGSPLELSKEF
ncbi:MAG: ATP-grasp domain-containing protein [Oligoflexia bacterium]|nr:ATP-grasp domain-containing protein [Oligoflexia bacterium]